MAKKHAEYENQLETLGDRNSYSKTDKDATFNHHSARLVKESEALFQIIHAWPIAATL